MQAAIRFILILIFLPFAAAIASCQTISLYETPDVRALLERFVQQNQAKSKIRGYRVQLLFTNDRRVMESEKRRYEARYEGTKTVWSYNDPYFQLRTGAFTTRTAAEQLLASLKREYPSSFVVEDDIQVVELLQ